MARSATSATSSRVKARRKLKPRRSNSLCKKKQNPQSNNIKNEEIVMSTVLSSPPSCCSSISSNNVSSKTLGDIHISDDEVSIDESGCSTPRAQRFRIPEISTCPPAPKKPKALSNCLSRKSPIPFFASPELDMFFLVALRDISV